VTVPKLQLAQDPAADALLGDNPFALLVGMLLDQQVPMETAKKQPLRALVGARVVFTVAPAAQ
jgi:hypothetical protein